MSDRYGSSGGGGQDWERGSGREKTAERERSRERRPATEYSAPSERRRDDSDDGSKLFVGNLSFETGERDLEDLFGRYGKVVEVKVILDRDTGRSRGFAFVTLGSKEEAEEAIQKLQGEDVHGRQIRVDKSSPRGSGPPRGGGGGYDRGGSGGYGGGGYGGSRGGGGRDGGYGGDRGYKGGRDGESAGRDRPRY